MLKDNLILSIRIPYIYTYKFDLNISNLFILAQKSPIISLCCFYSVPISRQTLLYYW
ncbi:hypothetical protein C2G38_2059039 [Gigaspora rosea]|uniref:Uncharacterized protein n=1 Tax=Gigaspora rosea TaxID=44941 RepID=A0A397W3B4_9GLOM|nr:hypothetical protein C2G38_2059039 [Gigaspora rosea]